MDYPQEKWITLAGEIVNLRRDEIRAIYVYAYDDETLDRKFIGA